MMKRWTLRILLFLILGCATTVAVAWGFSIARPVPYSDDPRTVFEVVIGPGIHEGFPIPAFHRNEVVETSCGTHGSGWTDGVRIAGPASFVRRIPLRPILPGFIINTLFYAAIWFGVFFGVSAGRRGLRRRRGKCVMCGYDLRGDLERGCPECGWNRSAGQP